MPGSSQAGTVRDRRQCIWTSSQLCSCPADDRRAGSDGRRRRRWKGVVALESNCSNVAAGSCPGSYRMMVGVIPIEPSAVQWSESESDRRADLLVLLHGYGSDEGAVFDQVRPLLPDMAIASIRGPLREGGGFAWVSMPRYLAARGPEAVLAMAEDVARGTVGRVNEVAPGARVGLLGISQGAVVALHMLRVAPRRFSYVVSLSGYVLAGSVPGDTVLREARSPVFWGRGLRDDLVPSRDIERTAQWLPRHSTLTARTYDIGHTESDQELGDAAAFVRSIAEIPSA